MIIAVSGSRGFIGTHLVKELNKLNHKVIELDVSNGFDITNWNHLQRISNFNVLIHLAAFSFVPDSYKYPYNMYNVNIMGTLNLLELCRRSKAKMVFTSSYVYGNPKYLPIDEGHPTNAWNPYCQSKIIGEELCRSYSKDFGVPVIIFRPFNIYGPGQNDKFLIPQILKQIKENGNISLKDPRPKRDYIFIDDVVNAYFKALKYKNTIFEIFNIGSGTSCSVKEITKKIKSNFKREIKIEFTNEIRKTEVLESVADISKAKKFLKWEPKITLEEGLTRLYGDMNEGKK